MKPLLLLLILISVALAQNSSQSGNSSSNIFLNETFHTGYISLDDRGSLWYWLFESRGSPSNDPLIVFYPGGPGHSSALSVFVGNGPYRINNESNTLKINPYSWNNIANVLYVDAPLGTGFSEALNNDSYAMNNTQAAKDFLYFLQQFVVKNPEYKGRDFYVAGESFTAAPISIFGNLLLDNKDALDLNFKAFHLSAFLVDHAIQIPSWPQYAYENGLINHTLEEQLNEELVPIAQLYEQVNNNTALEDAEDGAWGNVFSAIIGDFSWNPFNIKQSCEDPNSPIGCYVFTYIDNFTLQAEVIKALNVTDADNWGLTNDSVNNVLPYTSTIQNSIPELSKLLQGGIPGVFVTGEYELIWNWIGGERVCDNIEWSGQKSFEAADLKSWENYGCYKHYDKLTFVKVKGSGHFVSLDQPAASLAIISRLVEGGGNW